MNEHDDKRTNADGNADEEHPVVLPAEPLEDHVERVSVIPPIDVPKQVDEDAELDA